MSKITLRIDELEEILEFVKKVNPLQEGKLGSGCVEVEFQDGSGIGYLLKASVVSEIEGYQGVFSRYITDEKNW